MEDIIETIIGQEIVDECDTIEDLQAYAREKWIKQVQNESRIIKNSVK